MAVLKERPLGGEQVEIRSAGGGIPITGQAVRAHLISEKQNDVALSMTEAREARCRSFRGTGGPP